MDHLTFLLVWDFRVDISEATLPRFQNVRTTKTQWSPHYSTIRLQVGDVENLHFSEDHRVERVDEEVAGPIFSDRWREGRLGVRPPRVD